MSYKTEDTSDEELTIAEEDEDKINIGLYIGGRNSKGERDGRGWAILPNGDQYDGQYRQGKRHGIGLYVFLGGAARYFGQYRCGHRSGRGIFIYPDGSYYEGGWRRNLKHGKGRYCYPNGDCYCGGWLRGLRHGIGMYTMPATAPCGALRFNGTWRHGVRVGPFQLTYGNDDKCTTLHGTWDNLYPQGPAVFSFDKQYLLMGFFQTPGREASLARQANNNTVGDGGECLEEHLDENIVEQNRWADEPSLWFAQDICQYDYALLPQEPVPLPLSDSDVSICSLSPVPTEPSVERDFICTAEGEEEEAGERECIPCECSSSDVGSSSQICPKRGDPCAIEIIEQKC